jgi:hypothetical protein
MIRRIIFDTPNDVASVTDRRNAALRWAQIQRTPAHPKQKNGLLAIIVELFEHYYMNDGIKNNIGIYNRSLSAKHSCGRRFGSIMGAIGIAG